MRDARVVYSPILTHMHPGNPHGLRFIEGDAGDDGGTSGGDGDEGEDDEEDDSLDDLIDGDDEEDGEGDAEDDGSGDGGGRIALTQKELDEAIEKAVDRRINAKVKRRISEDRQGGRERRPNSRGRQWTPTRDDFREARDGYREAISDADFRFVNPDERRLANDLADQRMSSMLDEHNDPYETGRDIADSVLDQIRTMRKAYEKRVVSTLRSRGVLQEREKQGTKSTARKTERSGFDAGRARAEKMFSDRTSGDKKQGE